MAKPVWATRPREHLAGGLYRPREIPRRWATRPRGHLAGGLPAHVNTSQVGYRPREHLAGGLYRPPREHLVGGLYRVQLKHRLHFRPITSFTLC